MRLNDKLFLQVIDATPLVSIDLVIQDETGRVLLGRRVNRPAQGFWFVPGGRIWKNEKVRDALARISQHELGTVLENPELFGVYDHIYPDNFAGEPAVNTHYVVLAYRARLDSQTHLKTDAQHSALEWWSTRDLLASAEVHDNTKAYFR